MPKLTRLDICVGLLAETFVRYASKDGDPNTLSKSEVKELLQKELPTTLSKVDDQAAVDAMFNALDADGNGVVSFLEFATLAVTIADHCRHRFGDLSQQASCQMPSP